MVEQVVTLFLLAPEAAAVILVAEAEAAEVAATQVLDTVRVAKVATTFTHRVLLKYHLVVSI